MSEKATKHFNSGCVFGRVMEEPKKESSAGGKPYITFKVSCSGPKSGQVTAYCRLWDEERTVPFLAQYRKNPAAVFFLKGFYGQYQTEKNEFLSNFTIYQWEERDKVDPRAAFIMRGVVDQAQPLTDGSQRLLFNVQREGQQKELFELFSPGENLKLARVEPGQFIEVKGYVRQQVLEDDFGGSSGPIHAYIEKLEVL